MSRRIRRSTANATGSGRRTPRPPKRSTRRARGRRRTNTR